MNKLDKYTGCLIGGAAGDALGYEIEFLSERAIFSKYGELGITEYALHGGKAYISDDTQMTMFTAAGLISRDTAALDGDGGSYEEHIGYAYRDWYKTQHGAFRDASAEEDCAHSWLMDLPELYAQRAPGGTCLSAIAGGKYGSLTSPVNHSKGCGGVMRVAPIGLYFQGDGSAKEAARVGASSAALTHGHPLGYIPSAALAYLINTIVHGEDMTLSEAVAAMRDGVYEMFSELAECSEFLDITDRAVALAASEDASSLDAIHMLGEGWVAEEALAIALYCALKYENDFDRAIIASVNHGGDSDSTGAITGNILGAYLGLSRISEKYTDKLELVSELRELAYDLYCDAAESADEAMMRRSKYLPRTQAGYSEKGDKNNEKISYCN